MKRSAVSLLSGCVNLLLAATCLILLMLVLWAFPGAISGYSSEPEDLYLLACFVPLLASLGMVALLGGLTLLWPHIPLRIGAEQIARTTLAAALLLLMVSLGGFVVDGPGSEDLCLLMVPSLVLGLSYFSIRRRSHASG